MRNIVTSLIVYSALTSASFAVPFTLLTGVYRYTKLTNGNVTVEGGGLYSSGDYSTSFTQNFTASDLASRGLTAATLNTITGKFVTGADYIDSELATPEGRDRHSNYSFSTTAYTTDQGRVYLVSAGGFTPTVPTLNVTTSAARIQEGGESCFIVIRLSSAATDELIVPYTLGGTAKIRTDYTGPRAVRYALIPKGKTTFRIPVRPVDDLTSEVTETLVFRLSSNDGYKIGQQKEVTIRINDND